MSSLLAHMAQRREIPGIATAIPCNEGSLMAAATSKAAPTIANMRGKPRRPPALTRQHSQRCLPPARSKSPVTATAPQGVPLSVDVACGSRRYPVQRAQADSCSYSTILASYPNRIEDRHLFEGEPHRFPIDEPVHRRPLHVLGYQSSLDAPGSKETDKHDRVWPARGKQARRGRH